MSHPPDLEAKRSDAGHAELAAQTERLLNEANRAYRSSLHEPRAWQALRERRTRPTWLLHAGLASISAATIVWLLQSAEGPSASSVSELQPEPPALVASVDAAPPRKPEQPVRDKPAQVSQNEVLTKSRHAEPRAEKPVTEEQCRTLMSQGQHERALSCFEKLGHNGGLEADVAQLERARLALKLGRPEAAWQVLEQHEDRLAKSALRGEAAQLRVRVLYELGMNQRALDESEAVLSAPWGPAAAADMRWLRGRIYDERLGDCSRAIDEYLTLLGSPGQRADEAEFRRARCLEKVGRGPEARVAYQRYLKRSQPNQADQARAALERLGE